MAPGRGSAAPRGALGRGRLAAERRAPASARARRCCTRSRRACRSSRCARPFRAPPLLVSGTDAYRGGEYLYQDYLFDDHGADTGASSSPPGVDGFSPASGDLLYPSAARYANNAADLVELRIKPTAKAIVYRVTLGAVLADDAAVVGIGIDTDRSGGAQVAWPRRRRRQLARASIASSPRGAPAAEVSRLPGGAATALPAGAVTIDKRTNQMTIRVPRSLMDPRRGDLALRRRDGLWSGTGFERVAPGAPGVFNLAFRFDEPQPRGTGTWFEADQAKALGGGDQRPLPRRRRLRAARRRRERVDPRARAQAGAHLPLAPADARGRARRASRSSAGACSPTWCSCPRPTRAPIEPASRSRSTRCRRPTPSTRSSRPTSSSSSATTRAASTSRRSGRGPDGWYTDEAEVDFFEVWGDLARHFRLDPGVVALSGYSMGGYGTYKLGLQWPDLFGAAFTTVGPAAGRPDT